jgi:hypothetical protein
MDLSRMISMGAALAAMAVSSGLGASGAGGFRYWDAGDTSRIPAMLSATGIYMNISAPKKLVIPGAYHYEVNTALWSDGAKKKRWVLVKPGNPIGFKERDDYWNYPDSAVFVKEFDIDTVPGDTTTRVMWETRLLVNKKEVADSSVTPHVIMDRWYGYTYRWNADQKDARLVGVDGMNDSIRIWPNGRGKPSRMKKWVFPARYQCNVCHRPGYAGAVHGRSILGFFSAQLNRPHPDSVSINQLEFFFRKGLLTGVKPPSWETAPKWAAVDDTTAPVDLRARSYIAANCSGCHGHRGRENGATFVSLDYDFFTNESQMEFRNRSVSWPFGLDDSTVLPRFYPKNDMVMNPLGLDSVPIVPALTVPGYPQKSVLLFRQTSRDTTPGDYDTNRNQMPPLASYEVNEPAMALLRNWIANMKPLAPVVGVRAASTRSGFSAPAVHDRVLILPPGVPDQKIVMAGIDGRSVELPRIAPGSYAIPAGLGRGVYVIRIGRHNYTRYLF